MNTDHAFKEFKFRRNPVFGVLWFIGTIVWGAAAFLKWQYGIGALGLYVYFPVIGLFILNTFWSFAFPYVHVKAGTLTLRQGLFNVRSVRLADVRQIETTAQKLNLHFESGRKLPISFWSLGRSQRQDLQQTLELLHAAERGNHSAS